MKKIFLFFTIYILCNVTILAQVDLSGNYRYETGIMLKIEKDTFRLIMPNNARNGWYTEIMAEGEIKQINSSLIELNTGENVIWDVMRSVVVTQQLVDSIDTDSIKVRFSIPNYSGKLKVSVYTDTSDIFNLEYSDKNKELNIPKDTETFFFYITPDYLHSHTPMNSFYGVIGFDPMEEYQVDNSVNFIEIKIPNLTDIFFERYHIEGDYARVVNDSIIWKGKVYKKIK